MNLYMLMLLFDHEKTKMRHHVFLEESSKSILEVDPLVRAIGNRTVCDPVVGDEGVIDDWTDCVNRLGCDDIARIVYGG
jgi:hypothetical protein